jgi:hypothetical protein
MVLFFIVGYDLSMFFKGPLTLFFAKVIVPEVNGLFGCW